MIRIVIYAWCTAVLIWFALNTPGAHAQERYDPTTDPNVQSYMVCIQLASGGGDNSSVPDASNFDNVGYVQWSNGLGKFILCQEIDKS